MRVNQIHIDLDGVLNAWQLYQLKEFGVEIEYRDWLDHFGWDICAVYNHYAGEQWTEDDFWTGVKREHWANAPKSELFDLILERSEALVGRKNVFLLTSPTRCPDSAAGKVEWIYANLPSWMHRQTMIGAPKHIAAKSGSILIDDADHNIDTFCDSGGMGVLVPRPWNRNRGKDPVTFMTEAFNRLESA